MQQNVDNNTCIVYVHFACILRICSCNKTNEMPQIYFWNGTLHVSDRFFVHHQESSTVYTAIGVCNTGFAECLLAGSA
jgi:hypothetical protein